VPIGGVGSVHNFAGDLIVTIYLLSLFTMCTGLAGSLSRSRFSLMGAMRTLSQLFSYEAPFLMALLGPAVAAGSWQIDKIMRYASEHPVLLIQPISFAVALIGLMGKLEMPPFDAPEAPSEIVAGPLTEYSGRGLALFRVSRDISLVVGMTLIAAFYLGGIYNPLDFVLKTGFLLIIVAGLQVLFARLRIDQTVGLWWRYGMLLILAQWLALAIGWR
jgi:NADH-quinone oxidoreductase subunit H